MSRDPFADRDEREVSQAKARLAKVCDDLAAVRFGSSELQDERRALVVKLRAAGIGRPELAKLAGCSIDLIKQMTRKKVERKKKAATA